MGLISDWNDKTIDRICDIIETAGTIVEGSAECKATKWNRSGNRYRDHVSQAKYHVRKIEG